MILPVLLAAIIAIAIPAYFTIQAERADTQADELVVDHFEAVQATDQMEKAAGRAEISLHEFISKNATDGLSSYYDASSGIVHWHDEASKHLSAHPGHALNQQELLDRGLAARDRANELVISQLIPATAANASDPRIEAIEEEIHKELAIVSGTGGELGNLYAAELAEARQKGADTKKMSQYGSIISLFVALFSGILIAIIFAWRMTKKVTRVSDAAGQLADGELDRRVDVRGKDELAVLGRSFNKMADTLQRNAVKMKRDEARIRSIHQSLGEGIIVIDDQGTIESVNPAAEVALGRPAMELEGTAGTGIPILQKALSRPPLSSYEMVKCWKEKSCTHPECPSYESDDRRCWLQCGTHCYNQIQGTFKQKRDACERCEVFKQNAIQELDIKRDSRHYSANIVPILDESGQQEGQTVVLHDITALKNAKVEWETTFNSASEGILVVDPDHKIQRLNSSAARMLDSTVESLVGRNCCEAVHDTDSVPESCPMRTSRSGSGTTRREQEMPDGRTLEIIADNLVDKDGNTTGAIHFLRDVTEAIRLRQQLIESEKMVAVGQLVSGVAHEINNPLTGITGYAHLLARRDLDEKVRKDIDGINREAQRASRIVKQLLSFAREHKPEKKIVSINDVVDEALELMAYDLKVNNVVVEKDLAGEMHEMTADPHQLQQVFLNLIGNAEQAMLADRGGGVLRITTSGDDYQVRVEFSDDGPGIPEKIRERIFEPFFTTKEVGQGTGLGLSVCYGIVKDHGGSIRVEPTKGRGATIAVELPIIVESVPDAGEVQPQAPLGRMGNVLLVDDEESLRNVLTTSLKRAGHTVEVAENGEEALRKLQHDRYDCIISDIRMPVMDGATLHRTIGAIDADLADHFIFITGDTVNPETKDYLDRVDNPRLAKPFSPGELVIELSKMLGNN